VDPAAGKESLPKGDRGYITWSIDLMVLSVTKDEIRQMRASSRTSPGPRCRERAASSRPQVLEVGRRRERKPVRVSDPRAQIDVSTVIEPGPDTYCENGY